MKETKRLAFNFLRSYFDVVNKLQTDKDKLDFLLAVINKQFLNEDPTKLDFIPNLCYESQRHAIEKSVKGWIRANNGNPPNDPTTNPPSNPPSKVGSNPKEEEVKEEVEEKEQITIVKKKDLFDSFIDWFNDKMFEVKGVKGRYKVLKTIQTKFEARVKEGYNSEDFKKAFDNIVSDQYHKDNEYKYLTPEFLTRSDKLEKYCNIDVITKTETNKKKSLTMEELHKLRMS